MNDTLKSILGGWVRHGLTVLGGAMGFDAYMTSDGYTAAAGAFLTLGGLAWSAWQKYRSTKKGT